MTHVVIDKLTRSFDAHGPLALSSLDLNIDKGELLVLVGPSGCGKSTALRLIAGLDSPSSGTIRIADKDVTREPPQERDVAMVFQGYALYPHMTVREIMGFPLKMRKVPAKERDLQVERMASMLSISRLLDRKPAELSGGERQRVAMGRAMVRRPQVFLFDEPLSNLDAALRAELRVEIAALVKQVGTTSIYVTHDQVEAMTLGDRIAVMKAGALQQVDRPRVIYENPCNMFVASFLGTPAINFLDLNLEHSLYRRNRVAIALPKTASGALPQQAHIGFRPEHVELSGPDEAPKEGFLSLAASITSVEPLGAETYVYAQHENVTLRARAHGFAPWRRDACVTLNIAIDDLLWFDSASEARIRIHSHSNIATASS